VLRRDPNRTLRAESASGGSERAVIAPRRLLVAAQLAVAVTLLVASGLLVRSFDAATSSALGFDPGGMTLATVNLPRTGGAGGGAQATSTRSSALWSACARQQGRERARAGAAAQPDRRQIAVARAEAPDEPLSLAYNIVSRAMKPLASGRLRPRARRARRPTAPPAVMVNRAAAARVWGREPVGLAFTSPVRCSPAKPGPTSRWWASRPTLLTLNRPTRGRSFSSSSTASAATPG
jgi:hypothetical protein